MLKSNKLGEVMKICVDLHTHTIASGHHTTDTVRHIALSASEKGFEAVGITDHAPKMLSGAKQDYFNSVKMLSPSSMYGVKILYGAELNISNASGEIDLPEFILTKLDYTIASLHKEVFKPSTESENTKAILNAMQNKFVNIIGHPENPDYTVNFSQICECAKETGTIIELNSASLGGYRGDRTEIATSLVRECKKFGTYISLGSDSHGREKVGDFSKSLEILRKLDFPEDLVVNTNLDTFKRIVNLKRR